MESFSKDFSNEQNEKTQKKKYNEKENDLIDSYTKSLNPEEEISNLFKIITIKTNSDKVKYPKVRQK